MLIISAMIKIIVMLSTNKGNSRYDISKDDIHNNIKTIHINDITSRILIILTKPKIINNNKH